MRRVKQYKNPIVKTPNTKEDIIKYVKSTFFINSLSLSDQGEHIIPEVKNTTEDRRDIRRMYY